jgi:hypothetical protein
MMCLVLIVVFLFLLWVLWSTHRGRDHFGSEDQNYAITALENLNSDLHGGVVIDVGDRFLERFEADVLMVAKLENKERTEGTMREDLTFNQPVDTRYWPYYYYSYPYRYQEGGAWPPGMFTRMKNWSPGFETSGWSYWMRPGMSYDKWPRNRWVKNNDSYYYINNGKDRSRDFE